MTQAEVLTVMKANRATHYRIMSIDPWLQPYYNDIALRMERHANTRKQLLGDKADLVSFANGYLYYGFNRTETGWVYREWAPGADARPAGALDRAADVPVVPGSGRHDAGAVR